jgi:hypothetical protein
MRRRCPLGIAGVALALALAACSPSQDPAPRTPEVARLAAQTDADVGLQGSGGGSWAARAPAAVGRSAAKAESDAVAAPREALRSAQSAAPSASGAGDSANSRDDRPHRARFGSEAASEDVHRLADWVVDTADNLGLPFILVDKKEAKVFVFGPDGRLRDASPALLGLAHGDDSVPGIGERPMAQIRPEERTTPAGRFVAELGVNSEGEDILWVDYDDAISMHRVRATKPVERRLQRLASPTASDNRISYGCINLPAAFYDLAVKPAFAAKGGIVYVLPETRPLNATFPGLRPARLARR